MRVVLDVCCGTKMFWFNKEHDLVFYMDKRKESFVHVRSDCGNKVKDVAPDVIGSFTDIPFPDNRFHLVVFDPPHKIVANEMVSKGNIIKYYGALFPDWRDVLRRGFSECFRVLKPYGTLIFKWCEIDIPLSDVLALAPSSPLFGHRVGKRERSHWLAFVKPDVARLEVAK